MEDTLQLKEHGGDLETSSVGGGVEDVGLTQVDSEDAEVGPEFVRGLEVGFGKSGILGLELHRVLEGDRAASFDSGLAVRKKENVLGVGVSATNDREGVETLAEVHTITDDVMGAEDVQEVGSALGHVGLVESGHDGGGALESKVNGDLVAGALVVGGHEAVNLGELIRSKDASEAGHQLGDAIAEAGGEGDGGSSDQGFGGLSLLSVGEDLVDTINSVGDVGEVRTRQGGEWSQKAIDAAGSEIVHDVGVRAGNGEGVRSAAVLDDMLGILAGGSDIDEPVYQVGVRGGVGSYSRG